jgi:lantibiotic transport system ATP-binding protein
LVPERCIYGFLGPNGAGKTTTIRLLLGLLKPQRGSVHFFGQATTQESRGLCAALIESPSLYGHLSGRDNLEVTRRLLGVKRQRVDDVMARVGLQDAANQKAREYSLGMRQRLGIALALLGEPRILILDEPSNGLDPAGIAELRMLLKSFVELDGLTVLMSSHLLSEVEQIATHVGVLGAGKLLFQGTMTQLRDRAASKLRIVCDRDRARDAAAHLQQYDVLITQGARGADVESLGATTELELTTTLPAHVVNRMLVDAGFSVHALSNASASLEDLFFELTGATHAAH